jgi:exosortase A-associated hydrolase 1
VAKLVDLVVDTAITFECDGERLVGIVSASAGESDVGVLVLVGGPQYRVGSHRQFVLMARRLARAGVPVMRFDYRGMGDSSGTPATFEQTSTDVAAAVHAFRQECPSVRRIVLWGLCDAASAALLYFHATQKPCIAGLVLLNPWIRSEQSLASTHVKHYYGARIFEREFWIKLVRGGINTRHALREFAQTLLVARRSVPNAAACAEQGFQDRMASALIAFGGPVLVVLSGHDYVAKEFVEYTTSNPRWHEVGMRHNIERVHLESADHTFSTAAWRQQIEELTLDWLRRCFGVGR